MAMNGNNNNGDGDEGKLDEGAGAGTEGNSDEGAQAGTDDGSEGSQQDGDGGSDSQQSKTFTQEDVNKMMAKEKRQGRNSVYNELGIDPNDKKAIALIQALVASQKDEGDGQQGAESSAAVDEANQRALVAEAKAEAMMQGILPKYVDDAVALALPKVDDDNDLKSVLKDLKAKYPVWCEPDEGSSNVGKRGTGSSISSSGSNNGKKQESIGARLAASRKAGKPKQSYWGKK